MEGKKQPDSSFASDLFGAKDSSSGTFHSIFTPPARALSEYEKKNGSTSVETRFSTNNRQSGQEQSKSAKGDDFSAYYQEQKSQPFHYSSSIYYGGQDVYSQPQSAQNPCLTTFSKEIGEDDKGLATRGNWWQGSLYY